jgi:ABC-type uncharacterized transport system substrate-binding protein
VIRISWRSMLILLAVIVATLVPQHRTTAEQLDPRSAVPRIAYVNQGQAASFGKYLTAFRARLTELGYEEGRNVVLETHWAEDHVERLPSLMNEVVRHKVSIIVTSATAGAIAAKKASRTVPIVATSMAEPERTGLVASLAHPGGNLTGLSMGFSDQLAGKWLEVLQEIVPELKTVAVLANLDNPSHRQLVKDVQSLAPKRYLQQRLVNVPNVDALRGALEAAHRHAPAALLIADVVTLTHVHESYHSPQSITCQSCTPCETSSMKEGSRHTGLMLFGNIEERPTMSIRS